MKFKKVWLVMVLLAALGLMITACSRNNEDPDPGPGAPSPTPTQTPGGTDPTPAPTPTPEPVRNLNGMNIVIGNWWGNYDTDTAEPDTREGEARLDDRIAGEQRYNYRMREVQIGLWEEIQELATLSITAGDPAAHIFILQPSWFGIMNAQGMFHNLDALPSTNFSQAETGISWRHDVIDATRIGGNAHGWATETHTGPGIFFNMRLFEEAGLDPELPFDLQLRGEWTWDAMMRIADQLTRDTDMDGIHDTWAFALFNADTVDIALASNLAYYIGRDPQTGLYYNATNRPEFFDAMQLIKDIELRGYQMPQPEGSAWNWFEAAFMNGNAAMYARGAWQAGDISRNLNDPFGWVTWPTGPNNPHGPRFMGNANVFCIPATFTAQEADDIMFAYQQWVRPMPDFDDPDAWKAGDYLVHHPRSVDESLAMFARDPNRVTPAYHAWIDAPVHLEFSWPIFDRGRDVATQIESGQLHIEEAIARGNAR